MVIDEIETISVETPRQHFFRKRHTDRVGDTLAQRARGGLDTRRLGVFGMPLAIAPNFRVNLGFVA